MHYYEKERVHLIRGEIVILIEEKYRQICNNVLATLCFIFD